MKTKAERTILMIVNVKHTVTVVHISAIVHAWLKSITLGGVLHDSVFISCAVFIGTILIHYY